MITDAFDSLSPEIIKPPRPNDKLIEADACIITFSQLVFKYASNKYHADTIGSIHGLDRVDNLKIAQYKNKNIAFFTSGIGAPSCIGMAEDATGIIDTSKFVLFGSCGSLVDSSKYKDITVPIAAYRDEGTSYHYAPPSDYIDMPGNVSVQNLLDSVGKFYTVGKNLDN